MRNKGTPCDSGNFKPKTNATDCFIKWLDCQDHNFLGPITRGIFVCTLISVQFVGYSTQSLDLYIQVHKSCSGCYDLSVLLSIQYMYIYIYGLSWTHCTHFHHPGFGLANSRNIRTIIICFPHYIGWTVDVRIITLIFVIYV